MSIKHLKSMREFWSEYRGTAGCWNLKIRFQRVSYLFRRRQQVNENEVWIWELNIFYSNNRIWMPFVWSTFNPKFDLFMLVFGWWSHRMSDLTIFDELFVSSMPTRTFPNTFDIYNNSNFNWFALHVVHTKQTHIYSFQLKLWCVFFFQSSLSSQIYRTIAFENVCGDCSCAHLFRQFQRRSFNSYQNSITETKKINSIRWLLLLL